LNGLDFEIVEVAIAASFSFEDQLDKDDLFAMLGFSVKSNVSLEMRVLNLSCLIAFNQSCFNSGG
jgi:hypothetical protein